MSNPRFFDEKENQPRIKRDLFGAKARKGEKILAAEKAIVFESTGEDRTTKREKYIAEHKAEHISPWQKKLAKRG